MIDYPENGNLEPSWESVALELSREAVVGRLFSGTIHNLNGIVQAFSMHVDLLQSMFSQCDELIAGLTDGPAGLTESDNLQRLKSLLQQRAHLTSLLEEKVALAAHILQSNSLTRHFSSQTGNQSPWPATVNDIIQQEIDFLCADSFFKHQVDKNSIYDAAVPLLSGHIIELHQVCFALLENSLLAMRLASISEKRGQLQVTTAVTDDCIVITIQDSGTGLAPDILSKIYQPFFSTWPKRRGLGLYYAKTICQQCGWKIECISMQNPTAFEIRMPLLQKQNS